MVTLQEREKLQTKKKIEFEMVTEYQVVWSHFTELCFQVKSWNKMFLYMEEGGWSGVCSLHWFQRKEERLEAVIIITISWEISPTVQGQSCAVLATCLLIFPPDQSIGILNSPTIPNYYKL